MIAPGDALIVVPFASNVHQVKLINEAILLEKRQGSVYSHPVYCRFGTLRPAQNLGRIQVVVSSFNDLKYGPPLAGDANTAR
jgi:hypothetical protein